MPGARLATRQAEFGPDTLIACESVVRIFQHGVIEVQALQGLDLLVGKGEMVAIVGPSGSGKSTLMSVLACEDEPSAGRVLVDKWDLMAMSRADRVEYRRSVVGFVRQQTASNLVPYLDAAGNVGLPLALAGTPRRGRAARVAELLELTGVGHCAARRPSEMSGGEQQRVAISVALANGPKLLLADEPTGELDAATAQEVFDAMHAANRDAGVTVVIVTHDPAVSGQVGRTIAIRDGRASSEVLRRREDTEDGQSHVIAEEYAVMDRAGRIQIPREYREALAMTRRVRLALEEGHVALWPDGSP